MNTRLEALKERLGLQWNELADALGISVPLLGFIRRGDRPPSKKVLIAIESLESSDINTTTATKDTQLLKQRAIAAENRAQVAEKKLAQVCEALEHILKAVTILKEAVK
jgi:transcriptional regulator with XRE-family HTH domain